MAELSKLKRKQRWSRAQLEHDRMQWQPWLDAGDADAGKSAQPGYYAVVDKNDGVG
jgi:hypothetical protein